MAVSTEFQAALDGRRVHWCQNDVRLYGDLVPPGFVRYGWRLGTSFGVVGFGPPPATPLPGSLFPDNVARTFGHFAFWLEARARIDVRLDNPQWTESILDALNDKNIAFRFPGSERAHEFSFRFMRWESEGTAGVATLRATDSGGSFLAEVFQIIEVSQQQAVASELIEVAIVDRPRIALHTASGSNHALDDIVTIDPVASTASLFRHAWADVPGIKSGFRIAENENTGCALIATELFQPHAQTVDVRIEREFAAIPTYIDGMQVLQLEPGEWHLLVPDFGEVENAIYLPESARSTRLVPDIVRSLRDAWLSEIVDAISRQENLRNPNLMDAEQLDDFLELIGNFMDVTDWSDAEKRRLAEELPNFHEVSGTEKYIRFISFVRNVELRAEVLWTADYEDFRPEPDGPDWYRTNRIRLVYDYERFADSNFDVDALTRLFYRVAPLHDVLQEIVGVSQGQTELNRYSLGLSSENYVGGNQ